MDTEKLVDWFSREMAALENYTTVLRDNGLTGRHLPRLANLEYLTSIFPDTVTEEDKLNIRDNAQAFLLFGTLGGKHHFGYTSHII